MSYVPQAAEIAKTVQNLSATGTVTAWNSIVLVDASAAAVTVTLPTAVGALQAGEIQVIKTDASQNAVTIDGNAAETVNGAATITLTAQREGVSLESDGANVVATEDYLRDFRGTATTITAATYTATMADDTIWADATAAAITITLPTASSVGTATRTKKFTIKKVDLTANAVNIARSGTDTIETINSTPIAYGTATAITVSGIAHTFETDAGNNRWRITT